MKQRQIDSLARLARDHAELSARIEQLKHQSSGMICSGNIGNHSDSTCISSAFDECKELNSGVNYPDRYSYEEVWEERVAAGDVCESCQRQRVLKGERMIARKRLGAIRSGITRIGKNLIQQSVPKEQTA